METNWNTLGEIWECMCSACEQFLTPNLDHLRKMQLVIPRWCGVLLHVLLQFYHLIHEGCC